ncbi:MAG: diguanylate cyclase [Deltaproteobacteria bacterium]|nr:MAG: diguanylate cyclase [Deltaproteobacteria bacterium]
MPGTSERLQVPQMESKGTIYLVDDDEAQRRQIGKVLSDAGFEVQTGANGTEALSMVRRKEPDILLLDVEMPVMSGPQVCRIIRGSKGFGYFPIILVTARDDMQAKVDALELGADDYLVKPVHRNELLARVKSMLRLKKLQDELLHANESLKKANQRLQELSTTDPLMGIFNRLYFEKRFTYEFERAKRYKSPLSVMMIDIDHFKDVNDEMGHQFGDHVLAECARLLVEELRNVDIIARYGGEEIIVACPETKLEQARIAGERIRKRIESHEFRHQHRQRHITISVGISCYDENNRDASLEKLLKAADDALYEAKEGGRNRVCLKILGAGG